MVEDECNLSFTRSKGPLPQRAAEKLQHLAEVLFLCWDGSAVAVQPFIQLLAAAESETLTSNLWALVESCDGAATGAV